METITRLCSIPSCARERVAKGMCLPHYKRQRRRGTTHDITPEERFFASVEQSGDCWLWMASKIPAGYGKFTVMRQDLMAHRWAYEFLVAEIPDGLKLDHLCRTPSCVNPWHLEPVTNRVNVVVRGTGITAQNARKSHCIRGHEFDAANTYVTSKGRRQCRACVRIRQQN